MSVENINDRIILDHKCVCDDIDNILGEIQTLRSNKLFAKILGDSSAQKVKDNCNAVKRRLSDAFNIVIIGDFKRGKSTFINAIIGTDVVPTAVTPETVTINKISYSETPKAEAVLKNGKRLTLSHNELRRESIEKTAAQLPTKIDYIDVGADVDVLKEITIIDTPGLGESLSAFDEKNVDYLVNADALIYVVLPGSPLSMSERTFLSAAVMPQGFTRLMIVVNKADTLDSAEEINDMAQLVKERASEISPDIYVYILSALDELCRKKGGKRPEPKLAPLLEANFMEFETALRNDIIMQKEIIKSTRAIVLTRFLLNDLANRIELIKNSLRANFEKLISNEESFKNENSALMKTVDAKKTALGAEIDDMRQATKTWMTEFLTHLKDEIYNLKSDESVSVGDLERYLQFFMTDQIRSAVISCVEKHQKEISDKISDVTKSMANEITINAFGSVDAKIADNIADINWNWTNMDSAMAYADFLGDVAGVKEDFELYYYVAQTIAGYFRQKTVSKKQADYLTPILEKFETVINEVIKNIDTVYEKLKLSAIDKLQESFQDQIDMLMEAAVQAKQIAADESMKQEEVTEYLDSILSDLKTHKETLEKYD